MDAAAWQRLEKLFAQATELPADARAAFCDRACGDDPALHAELLSLLAAHEADHSVLDLPARTTAGAGVAAPVLPPGTRIGAWRLGALIGRGGAGEVYHVQRADGAFVQAAALKRLHRDAAPDIERFHVERQILASLEHPGIARLLDGGVADDGRLYAVVEYVAGEPLTTHCDRLRLGLDARLALFLQVCEVVAHAHRSLVVHRDLKPGNILVTAEGRVKLLDFGVAKRLDAVPAAGADATTAPFTSDYAAPEQLTGAPITTATDVYALGVILFELLAGQRPWQSEGMPVARIVQLIVHDEPPSMSRRVAAGSPVPPRRLEGDLDAIVATCLHKDAAARYPTVDALARDIERHRSHEPVAARGRARWYRFERALRRHRWALGGAALLFVSLAGGLVATAWQARRAEIERDAARRSASREEAVRYHITNLFRSSIAGKASAPVTAKTMLDRSAQRLLKEYRDDPQLAGKVVVTLADLYAALEDVEGQVPLLEGFLAAAGPEADRESVALAQQKLASIELLRGHAPRAAELLPRAEALWATDPARYREQHLESLFVRGQLLRAQGDLDGAIRIYQTAIAERTVFSGEVHRETANLYNSLAITLTAVNRLDEALAAYRTNLDIYRRLGQADDLDALVILGNTGTLALRTGHLREAEQILKSAVEKQRERAGDSAAVASAMGLYGSALTRRSAARTRPSPCCNLRWKMAMRFTGATSPLVVQDRLFLADALGAAGQAAKARETALQTLAMARERFGEASVLTLRARLGQARLDLDAGQAAGAYTAFAGLLEPLRKAGRPALIQLGHALMGCGEALLAQGRAGEAVAPLRGGGSAARATAMGAELGAGAGPVRLGEALKRSGSPGANDLLTQGAAALAAELGDGHAQVQRARRVLAAPG